MIFAAVDPGSVNAAVAVFHDGTPLFVDDIPVVDGMIDSVALAKVLHDLKVDHVVIERVHGMPKQGLASTFKFGFGTGIVHGVAGALRLPVTLVTPNQWKKFHSLNADKEKARKLAISKWPAQHHRLERVKDANRAEALLIGDWYYTKVLIPRTPSPF